MPGMVCGDPQEGESELEEVERQLAGSGKPPAKAGSKGALANGEAPGKGGLGLRGVLPPILLQAFVLTFLAEWGDRSQARASLQSRALTPHFPFVVSSSLPTRHARITPRWTSLSAAPGWDL